MTCLVHGRLLPIAALAIVACPVLLAAQSTTQTAPQSSPSPCSVVPQPDPCGSKPADKKTTTDKFPFPGENSPPSGSSSAAPSLTGVPQATDPPPAPLNPGIPANKKFPFPGEAGKPAKSDAAPGSSSSSSSSSSADDQPNPANGASSPDASDLPDLQDKGSEGQQTPGRHILHRVNPPGTKLQSPEERAAEDLDVAHFYMDSGDLAAAYSRSQDAVKLLPDDPEAHFTLAEAAAKLNKRDEAIEQYQQCLKLDPIDKQAKAARKALARLHAQR
ncbi:MAG TPA: tetratricopeptide repeat protein [Acidobacteriaceae bacterium]|nr:tetratricopeptide repeat protein [Acidobacteriaceae bacterium]